MNEKRSVLFYRLRLLLFVICIASLLSFTSLFSFSFHFISSSTLHLRLHACFTFPPIHTFHPNISFPTSYFSNAPLPLFLLRLLKLPLSHFFALSLSPFLLALIHSIFPLPFIRTTLVFLSPALLFLSFLLPCIRSSFSP